MLRTLDKTLRTLSGAVTAGLVILALAVAGAQYLGSVRGFPGPGVVSVAVHAVGAVLAIVSQRIADHRGRFLSVLGSLGVFVITAAVLWTQWWM